MKKLKERWGIKSNFQIFIILFVFSITGTSSLYISRPIIKYFGVHPEKLSVFWYWFLYILISLIAYQFLLLIFGWLFGQFHFFHNIVMKMLKRIGFGKYFKDAQNKDV